MHAILIFFFFFATFHAHAPIDLNFNYKKCSRCFSARETSSAHALSFQDPYVLEVSPCVECKSTNPP